MTDELQHTSDRVLETKIEYLAKLNEEKFKNQDATLARLEGTLIKIADAGYLTKAEYDKGQEALSMTLNGIDGRITSLEKTRERQNGFKMSWREILGWITGVGGVAVALFEGWARH